VPGDPPRARRAGQRTRRSAPPAARPRGPTAIAIARGADPSMALAESLIRRHISPRCLSTRQVQDSSTGRAHSVPVGCTAPRCAPASFMALQVDRWAIRSRSAVALTGDPHGRTSITCTCDPGILTTHRACRSPGRGSIPLGGPENRENRPEVLSAIGRVTRMPDRNLHAGPSGRPRALPRPEAKPSLGLVDWRRIRHRCGQKPATSNQWHASR
jgi:hypothetical protein